MKQYGLKWRPCLKEILPQGEQMEQDTQCPPLSSLLIHRHAQCTYMHMLTPYNIPHRHTQWEIETFIKRIQANHQQIHDKVLSIINH